MTDKQMDRKIAELCERGDLRKITLTFGVDMQWYCLIHIYGHKGHGVDPVRAVAFKKACDWLGV